MSITVLCYAKCTTCQKALKWLSEKQTSFTVRPIKEENPSEEELRLWHAASGLPLKRFFNTSGLAYKALNLKENLLSMSEDEQFALLASDGMLVKRPLLISEKGVFPGFKEAEWEKLI
ncbi:MAG: arsenate reductase family protein [Clostridia bacterium]|nr:arsenate reductase family protein [Clostridia bacterium]